MEGFEDAITHYTNRLRMASDEAERLRDLLKEMQEISVSSWEGRAAQALRGRLDEMIRKNSEISEELSNALISLGSIDVTEE